MKNEILPTYDDNSYLGDKGIRLVDNIISDKLRWIFRDIRKDDIGIDGQIEIVDETKATGRLLAVQIKCGKSYLSTVTKQGYEYTGEMKHLKYWLEHSLPVLVIICDPDMENCFWQQVTGANTSPSKNRWKMIIPGSNILGLAAEEQLRMIAGRPQHKDIIEALLYRFLYEKYIRNIEICSIFELPRDYRKYAYLAKINNEQVMIDFHYDMYGKINVKDIEDIVRMKVNNDRVCGPNPLHIYIVSESRSALKLSPEVINYLNPRKDIKYFRLLYTRTPLFRLDELDEKGEAITFWPND